MATHAPGWGWHREKHTKGFGRVCPGHDSVFVASGCDPTGAVVPGQENSIMADFEKLLPKCPVSPPKKTLPCSSTPRCQQAG